MSQKAIVLLAIVLVVAMGAFIFLKSKPVDNGPEDILANYEVTSVHRTNTVLTDQLGISSGEAMILEGDGTLTAQQDFTIDGALGCRDGSLKLITQGSLTINGKVVCQGDENADIMIVAVGGLTMAPGAEIITTGNVQLVDNESALRSRTEMNALYDEVEKVSEEGISVGPFIEEDSSPREVEDEVIVSVKNEQSFFEKLFRVAHAQVDNGTTTVNLTGLPIKVSGKIKVDTPTWKGAKRIVVFDFPNTPEVTISDFELEGPAGRAGEADTGSCDVAGKDGENAFRFNAFAPSLIVNNFTLTLGDGGEGGEAATGSDCEDAKAKGGDGGKPGNFRMIGSQNFEVKGAFTIHPGRGGAGGGATARGKVGEPGEKGGNANATAGKGADNKKKLTVSGTVAGTSNVQFGDAVGGAGGSALAEGGAGGMAEVCGETGGAGGKATAKGGAGGDAKLTVSGGAGRMDFATDIGGQGGIVEAYGGLGGAGGSCDETAKGGDGGIGGDASAAEGKGGTGKDGRATDGTTLGDDGGDGGRGGDGCTEGIGGAGGSGGMEDGEKGDDGTNICLSITKEEDYVSLLPGEIQVIQYKDYFIPISNLEIFSDESGQECDGAEHYHPGPNGAINLRGMAVPDPDSNECGFGKVSDYPIQIVQDPNYVESSPGDQGRIEVRGGIFGDGDGEMIQVDPPTLVIPAN